MSQLDLAQVSEAFAHGSAWAGKPWTTKPKVIWVHGAECTGCSVSLLSLFEDVTGKAIEGTGISTLAALDYAVGGDGTGAHVLNANPYADGTHPFGHRTLHNTQAVAGVDFDGAANTNSVVIANIADVLIDFIDLQYHETVMGMGGDLAYQWLKDNMDNGDHANAAPYVLVVEGSIQPKELGGYWNSSPLAPAGTTPWCSVGMGESGGELSFDDVVYKLAIKNNCQAVIPIGQCACFGGYPACVSPTLAADAKGIANGGAMTGAMGAHDFLVYKKADAAANKVIAVPGCPTNPWWFILTTVAWLVDFTQLSRPLGILTAGGAINPAAVDDQRRLKAVYGAPLHGPWCKRYQSFLDGAFAAKPGDPGCLQKLGCKGPQTMTLCAAHGWNGQQPHNNSAFDYGIQSVNGADGGNCVAGGAPCMGCTEKGYPDAFLPFVAR